MGFADEFMRGMLLGRQQKMQREQFDLQKQRQQTEDQFRQDQAKRQGVLDQQGQIKELLGLMQTQAMPREDLPANQAGPPAPAVRPTLKFPLLGGGEQALQPQYAEDVATQQRATEDAKRAAALDDLKQRLGIEQKANAYTITPQEAALSHGALQAGQEVSPQRASFVSGLVQADEAAKARYAASVAAAAARGDARKLIEDQAKFREETRLRSDYGKEIKPLEDQLKLASEAHQLSGLDTGAADTSLIELAQRVFNPGAIVRDSTMKRFLENGNLFERAKANVQQGLLSGGHLTPQMRAELLKALDAVAEGTKAQYAQKRAKHEGFAKAHGLDPTETFGSDPFAGETGPTSSQGGVVEWGRDARGNPVPITR